MTNLATIALMLVTGASSFVGYEYLVPAIKDATAGVAVISQYRDSAHVQAATALYQADNGKAPASTAELYKDGKYLDQAAKDAQLAALNVESEAQRDGDWVLYPASEANCAQLETEGKITDEFMCGQIADGSWKVGIFSPV